MTATMRPMSLGEIFDRTLQIYRRQFFALAGAAAFPACAVMLIQLADGLWLNLTPPLTVRGTRPNYALSILISIGYFHVSNLTALPFVPALFKLASNAIAGEACSLASALGFAWRGLRRFLWIGVLKFLAQLIAPEIVTITILAVVGTMAYKAGLFDDDGSWGVLLAVLVAILVGGFVLFQWVSGGLAFAFPASIAEDLSGWKALRRSWILSRKSRLRVVFTWITIMVISWLMMYGAQLCFRGILFALYRGHHLGFVGASAYRAIVYFLFAAISAFVGPIYPIAATLFYYDQRIRLEGYDIERMMQAAGMSSVDLTLGAGGPAVDVAGEVRA